MAMKIVRRIKAVYKLWRDKRILKSHGVTNWRDFNKTFDKKINRRAITVDKFYHSYPYVVVFESPPKFGSGHWLSTVRYIYRWCDEHCKGSYRYDYHRVVKQTFINSNEGLLKDQWVFNDIGGRDILVFAFTDSKDYVWFKMKFE
jgi:hypothetical protein